MLPVCRRYTAWARIPESGRTCSCRTSLTATGDGSKASYSTLSLLFCLASITCLPSPSRMSTYAYVLVLLAAFTSVIRGQAIACSGSIYPCSAYNETYCGRTKVCYFGSTKKCYNDSSVKEVAQCTDFSLADDCRAHGCVVGQSPLPQSPPSASSPGPATQISPAGQSPPASPITSSLAPSPASPRAVSGDCPWNPLSSQPGCSSSSSVDSNTITYIQASGTGTWCIKQPTTLFCFNATDFLASSKLCTAVM